MLVEREVRFKVHYEGAEVGEYSADMFVQGSVLVEVKALRALAPKDEMQLVHYLTGTRLDVGLLLNFGAESLQVRRKTRMIRLPPSDLGPPKPTTWVGPGFAYDSNNEKAEKGRLQD